MTRHDTHEQPPSRPHTPRKLPTFPNTYLTGLFHPFQRLIATLRLFSPSLPSYPRLPLVSALHTHPPLLSDAMIANERSNTSQQLFDNVPSPLPKSTTLPFPMGPSSSPPPGTVVSHAAAFETRLLPSVPLHTPVNDRTLSTTGGSLTAAGPLDLHKLLSTPDGSSLALNLTIQLPPTPQAVSNLKSKASHSKKQPEGHIRRPRNAFILFRSMSYLYSFGRVCS